METVLVCIFVVIFFSVFAVLFSRLSTNLELKSYSEIPVPSDFVPASESEKHLFATNFSLVGTRKGSKYASQLGQNCLSTLCVSHGTVESVKEDTQVGDGLTNQIQTVAVRTGDVTYEITNVLSSKDVHVGCKVLSFYSKDNNGAFVFRFAILDQAK